MKNIIFLSPPAAGKGTFSEYLVNKYGYIQLSTGDILRERAKTDSVLAETMASGKFVSDEMIMDIVEDRLSAMNGKPFILDGVPRTVNQALLLNSALERLNITDLKVIYIDTDKDILINRVTGRVICTNCHASFNNKIPEFMPKVENVCDNCGSELIHRADDNLESYEKRYNEFIEKTSPIADIYKEKGIYTEINNNNPDISIALKELEGVIND